MAKKEKKKREKITYIDDGRTIADMSGVPSRGFSGRTPEQKRQSETEKAYRRATPVWREHLSTYFAAVRMMILPMLTAIAAICIIFLILYLAFNA